VTGIQPFVGAMCKMVVILFFGVNIPWFRVSGEPEHLLFAKFIQFVTGKRVRCVPGHKVDKFPLLPVRQVPGVHIDDIARTKE
jgi:hypothetical protein